MHLETAVGQFDMMELRKLIDDLPQASLKRYHNFNNKTRKI